MIILLVAGIACLALCAFQLTRPRLAADRERRAALETVRSAAAARGARRPRRRRARPCCSRACPRCSCRVHMKLWRKESPDDITAQLRRAGASRRLTAEKLHGRPRRCSRSSGSSPGSRSPTAPRRSCSRSSSRSPASISPASCSRRRRRGAQTASTAELPHFVDQLAIAIEAGMSFDAALNYLIEATRRPLAEELGRIMTELRVGESRRAALRSFADRVGSENVDRVRQRRARLRRSSARRWPTSCAPRRPTSGTAGRCTPRSGRRRRR